MRPSAPLAASLAVLGLLLAGCGSPGPVPDECPPPPQYPAPSSPARLAADAGEDFGFDGDAIHPGDRVLLNGTASLHFEGKPLTYHWDQLAGPCVTLDGSDQVRPSFRAPNVPPEGAVLLFQLVVESEGEFSAPDQADVQVRR